MHIDQKRIKEYLYEIKRNSDELADLLKQYPDDKILGDHIIIKAIKYILIETAEAMANTLQHIMAKEYGKPVTGYLDTLLAAKKEGLISDGVFSNLQPFFKFRHALVHRYWIMDDRLILANLRSGSKDFYTFIEEIEQKL